MDKSNKHLAENQNTTINYTKEAFLWPFHLIGMGIIALAGVVTTLALNHVLKVDTSGIFLGFVGMELIFLGLITRSKRFRKAIASKYRQEIGAFNYVQKLTEMYNDLSLEGQRRFEKFRGQLTLAKKNYSSLNKHFPELVAQYVNKIDGLQMNFIRLLSSYDHFPAILAADNPNSLKQQIDEIRTGMGDDNPKLVEVKKKRIDLLQKRIRNYHQALDNQTLIEQQLKTVEETMKYFVEQSISGAGAEENTLIDSLLKETNDLHGTLNEIEAIYRSDLDDSTTMGGSSSRDFMTN